jgi:hypothetical protein
MADYRLLLLAEGGKAQGSDFEAADDGEAIELARLRLEKADIEIWCGDRKVAFVPRGMPPILAETR